MWKKSLMGIMFALVLAMGLVAAQNADACCVYNDTGLKIKAAWHLAPDWHLTAHSHKCENGKGGKLDIIDDKHLAYDVPICMSMHVDKHGYVKIKQDDNTFHAVSYRKDGTVRDQCTRTIYSETKPEASETK